MKSSTPRRGRVGRSRPLRVGFLPVSDCAPLLLARENAIYEQFDLKVELQREPNWKSIHDKLARGELDAAHAPAALPFLTALGLTGSDVQLVTGLLLGLQGNAITISNELLNHGASDAATFGRLARRNLGKRTYTFGVPLPFAAEYFLLCQWLDQAGLSPAAGVRLVTAAPAEMFPLLHLGYLDGYCVGEPWNTLAERAGVGQGVATSASLAPLHPEKALIVRKDFAERRATEHERLLAALLAASELCDRPEHRVELCHLLSRPEHVDAPVDCLQPGLVGPFGDPATGVHSLLGLNLFYRHRANSPSATRAGWIIRHLHQYFRWRTRPPGIDGIFRPDIYQRAKEMLAANPARTAGEVPARQLAAG